MTLQVDVRQTTSDKLMKHPEMKIHIITLVLFAISLIGCPAIRENVEGLLEPAPDTTGFKEIERQITRGGTLEAQIDQKILEAVKQIAATLRPGYRRHILRKYRLGFLEISSIDNDVTMLHNYVTEKTLTLSFLQPVIANNFNIVERFLLKDVLKELYPDYSASSYGTDQRLARSIGKRYRIDVIETGVITESEDFLDINLRMIETKRGRIIAVGSVKIEKTQPVWEWLNQLDP